MPRPHPTHALAPALALAVACGSPSDAGPAEESTETQADDGTTGSTSGDGSSSSSGADTSTETDTGTGADDAAPTLEDVRAEIDGALIRLDQGDVRRFLAVATPVAFTVQANDDRTALEALEVILLDASDAPLPGVSGQLVNGLWELELALGPGATVRPQVTDGAGQSTAWPHALQIPTREEATVATWEWRRYAEDQSIEDRLLATYAEDGTWVEDRQSDGRRRTGTYTIEADMITIQVRTDDSPGEDTDPDTVEFETEGILHTDDLYLAQAPLEREGTGDGLRGTWNAVRRVAGPPEWRATTRLTLNADGTYEERVATGATDMPRTVAGRYAVVPNENYTDPAGDFLHFEPTHVDGEETRDEPPRFELYARRGDRLLLSPWLRR